MLRGQCRIGQKTQRDPARREFLLGLVDVARGKRCVACDQIGAAVFAGIDHLARQQAPLHPPFVQIVEPGRVLRRAEHELGGLGEFLFTAEQLDLAEDIAGIAMQFVRNRLKQCARIGGLLGGGDPCLGQCDVAGSEPLCSPHRSFMLAAIQQQIHPRLLVARCQQRAEQIERGALGIFRHRIVAPGFAHQAFGIGAVAAREHRPRQRQAAFGRHRRFGLEPRPHDGILAMVVPQRRFQTAAQESLRRPARVGRQEGAIAFGGGVIVVAAQDDPFRKLLGDRIGYRGLKLGRIVGPVLADQLDDVLERVGIGL
jgi:hypothetical protein